VSSTPESVFFSSSGLRMHAVRVHAAGDPPGKDGPRQPVVVVPGITTPAAAIQFAAESWARFTGDLYVLDMRGRGLSERAGYGGHRALDYAADVLALISHLGLESRRPLLVGHSLGARVVSTARALVPGCCAGVVAIDPPMSGPGRRPYPMGLDRFILGIQGARAGRGANEAREHYPGWTDEQVRARGESLGSCDELAVIESYSWFHLEAFPPVWAEVEPPALLLFGAESPVVTAEDAAEIERVNPRSDVVSIAKAGHMVPWDNPAQTAEEIEAFMSKLEGRL
jgi:N-formylmaleamate deformylase